MNRSRSRGTRCDLLPDILITVVELPMIGTGDVSLLFSSIYFNEAIMVQENGEYKPVWKSMACASGAHGIGACRLRRAVTNRHRHAIDATPARWRGGRRGDSGTRRNILISTQASTSPIPSRGVVSTSPRRSARSRSTRIIFLPYPK